MVSHGTKSQQGRSASTPSILTAGKTSLIEPPKPQRPQKADDAKVEESPNKTEEEYMERVIKLMEKEDRELEEEQKKAKKQAEKGTKKRGAEGKRVAGAGAGAAGSQTNNAHKLDKKQSQPASDDFWDGFITEKPPFPLSELIALKPCSFSAHFYAYARRNGRTGVIKTGLIEDILENSAKTPLDDTAEMSAIRPGRKAAKAEPEVEGGKSKDKAKSSEEKDPGATSAQEAAANSDPAIESEITAQTFEQVCGDLKAYIEAMDSPWSTGSGIQQPGCYLETYTAVTERVKGLAKHSLAQHHMAAENSSSLSTPPAIDPKTQCVVPCLLPWDRAPCGQSLPCIAHQNKREPKRDPQIPIIEARSLKDVRPGDFAKRDEKIIAQSNQSKHLRQKWDKRAVRERTQDDGKVVLSYSEAAKAAARYYALTSAYGKPS